MATQSKITIEDARRIAGDEYDRLARLPMFEKTFGDFTPREKFIEARARILLAEQERQQ